MIAWVVEAARRAERVDRVLVATDDERIVRAARAAGAETRLTRSDHATGTDRVAEAVRGETADVILNLQGDEPMLRPQSVDRLVAAFDDPEVRMATLGVRGVTEADRLDPMKAKIVVNARGDALYFSRAPIPYRHLGSGVAELGADGIEEEAWRHVGSYGFRPEVLADLVGRPRGGLEAIEDLEQLRALESGWSIRVVEIEDEPICVDVPQDVGHVETVLRSRGEGVLR
jgi:3-deoxy-manno-octulosonate cytidylyltransferase (CMP-KDO synthetase)